MSSVRNLKGCQKALSHTDLEAKPTNMLELQRHRFLCNTLQAQVKMSQFEGIQSHFHRAACIFIIRLNMISLKELLLWLTVTFFFFIFFLINIYEVYFFIFYFWFGTKGVLFLVLQQDILWAILWKKSEWVSWFLKRNSYRICSKASS